MNKDACKRCDESPWVKKANKLMKQYKNNATPNELALTIEFLLSNGFCGINNRTSIDKILNFLEEKGIDMSREEFQQQVLTELKRSGVVATLIYAGPRGGVFIPCVESDLKESVKQVFERTIQQLINLEQLTLSSRLHNIVTQLRNTAQMLKDQI